MEHKIHPSMRKYLDPKSVELTGRPKRDTIISSDEILNLKIALETTSTINEFLKVIG